MTKNKKQQAQFITPDSYPQMMGKQDAALALKTLRASHTMDKAQVVMEQAVPPLKRAILQYVAELEAGARDMAAPVGEDQTTFPLSVACIPHPSADGASWFA